MVRTILITAIAYGIACAQPSPPALRLMLDGHNGIEYSHQSPSLPQPRCWYLAGHPGDTAIAGRLSQLLVDDSARAALHARFGSETGDPHLNGFDTPGLPNRDHLTDLAGAITSPRPGLTIVGLYRYDDTYSDRFDSIWAVAPDMHAGPHARTPPQEADGLLQQEALAYTLARGGWHAEGSASHSARWGVTPLFGEPIWFNALRTEHHVSWDCARIDIQASLLAEHTERWPLHMAEEEFNRVAVRVQTRYRLGANRVGVETRYDNSTVVPAQVSLVASSGGRRPLSAHIRAGVNSSLDPHAEGSVSATLGLVTIEASAGNAPGNPALPDTFEHLDTMVFCSGSTHRETTARLAISLCDSSRNVVSAGAWVDFTDLPLWQELQPHATDTLRLRLVESPDGAQTVLGAQVCWAPRWHWGDARTWARGHLDLFGREALHVPWDMGTEITARSQKAAGVWVRVGLLAVGPVTERYRDTRTASMLVERSCDSRVEANLACRMPFRSPLFASRIRPAIEVGVDHLNLTGQTRQRQLTPGNLMGPRIEVSLDAVLVPQRAGRDDGTAVALTR